MNASSLPILPAHYGLFDSTWPPGFYWVLEIHDKAPPGLLRSPEQYWTDAGPEFPAFVFTPQFAAGFRSQIDCYTAWAQRHPALWDYSKWTVQAVEHEWVG